ncbi:MAG: hypothetical protein CM15mP85_27810 [Rhodobacterales bacterium]|nr:MAG: hypothetical protein CM15mP85_27810 [Rhodobacterales bacterium]
MILMGIILSPSDIQSQTLDLCRRYASKQDAVGL